MIHPVIHPSGDIILSMRLWLLPLLMLPLAAQTPSFEVASIRPSNARTGTGLPLCGNINTSPDTLLTRESALRTGVYGLSGLLGEAYHEDVDDFDYPQWTRNFPTFAVSVKVPADTTSGTCHKMLQNLLAERFHMVTGVEIREVPRYYLKVSKSGLKLKPAGSPADPDGGYSSSVKDGLFHLTFRSAPAFRVLTAIRALAELYARARNFAPGSSGFRIAGVVDETGLTGYYDGEFKFDVAAPLHSEFAESVEDALARQLGLTLEFRTAPGRVLVIRSSDHTPTEN